MGSSSTPSFGSVVGSNAPPAFGSSGGGGVSGGGVPAFGAANTSGGFQFTAGNAPGTPQQVNTFNAGKTNVLVCNLVLVQLPLLTEHYTGHSPSRGKLEIMLFVRPTTSGHVGRYRVNTSSVFDITLIDTLLESCAEFIYFTLYLYRLINLRLKNFCE